MLWTICIANRHAGILENTAKHFCAAPVNQRSPHGLYGAKENPSRETEGVNNNWIGSNHTHIILIM